MSSRVESEIIECRNALDKLADNEAEKVVDILATLRKHTITINLLESTSIGATLQKLKKAYANTEAGAQVKGLISKWKKDCDTTTTKPPTKKEETKFPKEVVKPAVWGKAPLVIPKVDVPTGEEPFTPGGADDDDGIDDQLYQRLEPTRKKMMDLFVEHFKANTQLSLAKFLAFNVESSINKLHNVNSDGKAYLQKAKSIAYNLKKNESLRLDIINGSFKADHVAYLSANDLATDDIRGTRKEVANETQMARRGDLYEITRSDILSANGIDPNAGGDFVCRRCKGTKTTHYAMQTRSSDEPMTIFVCCLTCYKRWRE